MATATQDSSASRLFQKYRSWIICIGVLLFAQAFLSARVYFSEPESSSRTVQSGLKNDHGSVQEFKYSSPVAGTGKSETLNSKQAQIKVSKTKASPTTETKLNLELLNFTPDCEITVKDSISAIHRAKTQQCKEQLAKTACGIQNGSLYPKRLPRFCHNEEYTYRKYLGCYQDVKNNRILNDSFALRKIDNSPYNCVDWCLQSGFSFAGVQYSVECFCGNQRPLETAKLDPTLCYMKCPSDESNLTAADSTNFTSCGGYFAMDVYETGIIRNDESKTIVHGLEEISETLAGKSVSTNQTVRIVFFLTLNGRALRQVIRLIKALFHQRHYFYIHVDARQDYLFRELLILGRKLPENVRFMTERKGSIWGGASLLTVLLTGMKELALRAEEWNWEWDYVINLSESDFPLKTIERLQIFLTLNKGKNFVKSHGRDVLQFIQKQGLDKTFDECEFRMWRMGDRTLPTGIFMDGGSDWIALHRGFVEYLVKTDDELISGLKTIFKHTLLPAESFFHTALRNSEHCGTFVDNNLHVTNWKRKLGCKCQYRNIVDWCGCSPNDFRLADWSRLQMTESRLIFFGRKFESVVNQGIVNQLESALFPERYKQNSPTLDRYWQSIYHHYDLSPKPDDALLTVGHSLSRLAMKIYLDENSEAELFIHLLEISIYLQEDQNQGILVRFSFSDNQMEENPRQAPNPQIEAWFSFQNWVAHDIRDENMSVYHSRILNLRVGTDYDQKEQIFRNFAGVMGPKSEPTLAYSCLTDESFNVTFTWINPKQSIQSRQNVSIGIGETANFLKPTFRTSLMPGDWTVKLFDISGRLIAQTQFLIVPLSFYNDQERITISRRANAAEESRDENEHEEDFRSATDHLVSKFYILQDMCLGDGLNQSLLQSRQSSRSSGAEAEGKDQGETVHPPHLDTDFTLCSKTQWSSRYPDPKSTIDGIDELTGLLIP